MFMHNFASSVVIKCKCEKVNESKKLKGLEGGMKNKKESWNQIKRKI